MNLALLFNRLLQLLLLRNDGGQPYKQNSISFAVNDMKEGLYIVKGTAGNTLVGTAKLTIIK